MKTPNSPNVRALYEAFVKHAAYGTNTAAALNTKIKRAAPKPGELNVAGRQISGVAKGFNVKNSSSGSTSNQQD